MLTAIMLLAATPGSGCDLIETKGAVAVHEALAQRAVQIISAASTVGAGADRTLADLVDPAAKFNLFIGDVGSPGTGLSGARSLAKSMASDEFRYLGWDYMNIPANACDTQSITVDFINNRDRRISRMVFTFQQARLTSADGWQHSFESGRLPLSVADRGGS